MCRKHMLMEAAECDGYLAGIQDWPVASAAAQITIKAFLQDILGGSSTLLLAFAEGLVGGDNKARSAEAAL